MSYVIARHTEAQKMWAFRLYMADCGQILCSNVAESLGGKVINRRLGDIITNKRKENRSPEEIIEKICNGLRELGEGK